MQLKGLSQGFSEGVVWCQNEGLFTLTGRSDKKKIFEKVRMRREISRFLKSAVYTIGDQH
mgnify:CR=1 FL=1